VCDDEQTDTQPVKFTVFFLIDSQKKNIASIRNHAPTLTGLIPDTSFEIPNHHRLITSSGMSAAFELLSMQRTESSTTVQ